MLNTCISLLAITLALTTIGLYLSIKDSDNSNIDGVIQYLTQNVNQGPIDNIIVRNNSCLLDEEDRIVLFYWKGTSYGC